MSALVVKDLTKEVAENGKVGATWQCSKELLH
jgi:hypothetical protein